MIADLPPQGDPVSLTCRWCRQVRTEIVVGGVYRHRVCKTCDAPEGKPATWDRS